MCHMIDSTPVQKPYFPFWGGVGEQDRLSGSIINPRPIRTSVDPIFRPLNISRRTRPCLFSFSFLIISRGLH